MISSKISSPFTYRSFVKQVADLVGVDHATVAAEALSASSTMPEPLVPGQEEEVYARPHQFQPVKPKNNLNWLRMVSLAGVVGVVFIYFVWRNGGIEAAKSPSNSLPSSSSRTVGPDEATPPPSAAPTQQQELAVSNPPSATLVPVSNQVKEPATQQQEAPVPAAVTPGTEQLLPPAPRTPVPAQNVTEQAQPVVQAVSRSASTDTDLPKIHIELSAIQPTWLSISADGKTTYSGTLGAMKTMSFDGKETAQVRTANAGGVNIIFNGRALGPLGRHGQSRTFVFTKSGYEVVQGLGSSARVVPTGGE